MGGEVTGDVSGDLAEGRHASHAARTHVVTQLPGDGVGPEVTEVARACVDAVAARYDFHVDWRTCNLGGKHYLQTGEVLPDRVLTELRDSEAILLGAVGTPDVPPGVLERGLLLRLRFELDLYVNLRPSKLRPGVGGPVLANAAGKHQLTDLDFVIVRENTEGLYAGAGGSVHKGTEFETATEESLNTWAGVRRCVRYAAALAAARSGRLTLVHKTNVLTNAGDLWYRIAREVAAETGVELGYAHVDAACLWLVDDPKRFDVIVTDNLFGDILSDLGAALTGGLGYAPSGNLNPDKTGPSVFEPVHGSAPDIAGKGLANPAGAVLSAGLMLTHLGEDAAAAELDSAVDAVLAAGAPASTGEWEKALLAQLTTGGPA
jgi:3-isopropylmalate dehydrogenase